MKPLSSVIKKRAERALDAAEILMKHGFYDTVAFLAGYATLLYTRAVLLDLLGEYPKTLGLRDLLLILRDVYQKCMRFEEAERIRIYLTKEKESLLLLEDAYLHQETSIKYYSKEESSEILVFARKFFRFIGELSTKMNNSQPATSHQY
ncbi:MAG: hypothetical protein DRJ47_02245 [Thermoprotei archaeon]|nr:MAG: hypothetical protein DRJ47_02245 [Thermoprotei archaeon]